jgi:hypothetical protein
MGVLSLVNRAAPSLALVLVVGAGGCELIAGIEDKVLVSGPVDATANDAFVPSGLDGAGPSDNAVGNPLPDGDAGVVADASHLDEADASASPDSPSTGDPFAAPDAGTTDPSAPCASQPPYLFCDDFTEATLTSKWEYQLVTDDGGTMSFFSQAYTSPPQSMLVAAPASTGAQQVALGQAMGTVVTQFRLAFDLRIDMDSLANTPVTAIAQVIGQRQGKIMELNFLLQPSGQAHLDSLVSLDSGAMRTIDLPTLPLRKWTRLVIVYDASAGVSVLEDGQTIGSDTSATAGAPEATQILMGMVYQLAPGTDTIRFEMDNIVFRGQ